MRAFGDQVCLLGLNVIVSAGELTLRFAQAPEHAEQQLHWEPAFGVGRGWLAVPTDHVTVQQQPGRLNTCDMDPQHLPCNAVCQQWHVSPPSVLQFKLGQFERS